LTLLCLSAAASVCRAAYWCFSGDTRVFVQTTLAPSQLPLQPVNLALQSDDAGRGDRGTAVCEESEEEGGEECAEDRLVQESAATPLRPSQPAPPATPASSRGGILLLNGKRTAPAPDSALSPPPTATRSNRHLYASKPSRAQHTWRIYGSMLEIWMLVEALDERGVREKHLKSQLRAQFGMNKGGGGGGGEVYSSSGSEYIGRKIRRTFGKVRRGVVVVGGMLWTRNAAVLLVSFLSFSCVL
jgi:hypothetical protein